MRAASLMDLTGSLRSRCSVNQTGQTSWGTQLDLCTLQSSTGNGSDEQAASIGCSTPIRFGKWLESLLRKLDHLIAFELDHTTMEVGQKGVKYGLQVRAAPRPAAALPVRKRGVFTEDSDEEDAKDTVEQQIARQAARKQSDKKVWGRWRLLGSWNLCRRLL